MSGVFGKGDKQSIFGPDAYKGFPNPMIGHAHPYPTRYHGPIYLWPKFSMPYQGQSYLTPGTGLPSAKQLLAAGLGLGFLDDLFTCDDPSASNFGEKGECLFTLRKDPDCGSTMHWDGDVCQCNAGMIPGPAGSGVCWSIDQLLAAGAACINAGGSWNPDTQACVPGGGTSAPGPIVVQPAPTPGGGAIVVAPAPSTKPVLATTVPGASGGEWWKDPIVLGVGAVAFIGLVAYGTKSKPKRAVANRRRRRRLAA